ncbi:MAG TPA: PEGA domain-containing protein, partial [Kofleriaceae bacterium]
APAEKPAAAAGANGSLMISSKPPCEIEIDGKSTGLRTPQRAIALSAGPHKVTLVNSEANVNKSLMVQINAGQSTKLVKDLTGN